MNLRRRYVDSGLPCFHCGERWSLFVCPQHEGDCGVCKGCAGKPVLALVPMETQQEER